MDVLNSWFTSIEDLSAVDEKIARLQASPADAPAVSQQTSQKQEELDPVTQIIGSVHQANDLGKLIELRDEHGAFLAARGFAELLDRKICLFQFKRLADQSDKLLTSINELNIDETDKFNQSFFFESEVDSLSRLLVKILRLANDVVLQSSSNQNQNQNQNQKQMQNQNQNTSSNQNTKLVLQLLQILLSAYIEKVLVLKKAFVTLLKQLVGSSNWTEEPASKLGTVLKDITSCCVNFNYLQNCYIVATDYASKNSIFLQESAKGNQSPSLSLLTQLLDLPHSGEIWSVEMLAHPIITKFIFHFYGKNLTNRLSQPELATEYFLSYLQDELFLRKVGRLFSGTLRLTNAEISNSLETAVHLASDSSGDLNTLNNDSLSKEKNSSASFFLISHENKLIITEFIKVFNKFLKIKFLNDLKANKSAYFNKNSRLFTNLLYQLNRYDTTIFDLFYYTENNLIVDILLSNDNWSSWIELERLHLVKNFNDKFPSSMSSSLFPESGKDDSSGQSTEDLSTHNEDMFMNEEIFSVDFNIVKSSYLKPTKVAVNFSSLLKNLVDFITNLKMPVALKLKLLTELVFQLLDLYHDKFRYLLKNSRIVNSSNNRYLNSLITESLIAFNKQTKKPTEKKKMNRGTSENDGIVSEIKTLCKIYCSVKYIAVKLETYDHNTEFLKVVEFVKRGMYSQSQAHRFGQLVVALKLDVGQLRRLADAKYDSVFHEKTANLNAIADEIVSTLNNFLKKSLKIYLRNYLNLNSYWTETGQENSADGESVKTADGLDLEDDIGDGWNFDEDWGGVSEENEQQEPSSSRPKDTKSAAPKKHPVFRKVATFEDYINYGFLSASEGEDSSDAGLFLAPRKITRELQSPINILLNQLRYLRRCFGTSYLSTFADYKAIETQLLNNLYYYFYSYIIKINRFSLGGIVQLKFDYLAVLARITRLLGDPAGEETIDYRSYESMSLQQYLVKIVDCCNVLMVSRFNLGAVSPFGADTSAAAFQRFRMAQDFQRLRAYVATRSLSDDEIYDMVSRIVY